MAAGANQRALWLNAVERRRQMADTSAIETTGAINDDNVLSGKRQVVLPADLCRQVSLAPGVRVRVELAPDGDGILVRPDSARGKKPASVLFDRIVHRGKPLGVEDLQGLAVAKKQGKP